MTETNPALLVEPEGNVDERAVEEYEELTKILICTNCQQRFSSHAVLRSHMAGDHNVEVLLRSLRINTNTQS